jgi:hypothetical protein
MLGLNDHYLARHRPASFGSDPFFVGHELADGAYVLGRQPDLVLFGLPGGNAQPWFRSDRELLKQDGFRENYQLAAVHGAEPHAVRSLIWVRRNSATIGMQRSGRRLVIPGFFLGDPGTTWSHLDPSGRLVTEIPGQARASLRALPLTAGTWRVSVEPDSRNLRGRSISHGVATSEPCAFPLAVAVADARELDVEVENPSERSEGIHQIELVLDDEARGPTGDGNAASGR